MRFCCMQIASNWCETSAMNVTPAQQTPRSPRSPWSPWSPAAERYAFIIYKQNIIKLNKRTNSQRVAQLLGLLLATFCHVFRVPE